MSFGEAVVLEGGRLLSEYSVFSFHMFVIFVEDVRVFNEDARLVHGVSLGIYPLSRDAASACSFSVHSSRCSE